MSFEQFIQNIIDEHPEHQNAESPKPQKITPTCKECGWSENINENDLCVDCQKANDRGYQINQLAGRCANGSELDHGVLFHVRLKVDSGYDWQALCGYQPGRRSAGWSSWKPSDRKVTCKKCLRRLANKLFDPTSERGSIQC